MLVEVASNEALGLSRQPSRQLAALIASCWNVPDVFTYVFPFTTYKHNLIVIKSAHFTIAFFIIDLY